MSLILDPGHGALCPPVNMEGEAGMAPGYGPIFVPCHSLVPQIVVTLCLCCDLVVELVTELIGLNGETLLALNDLFEI